MWGMVLGAVLILMKIAEVGPVANWSWWVVMIPFAVTIAWWEIITPMFGLREKAEQRRQAQLEKEKYERLYGKKK